MSAIEDQIAQSLTSAVITSESWNFSSRSTRVIYEICFSEAHNRYLFIEKKSSGKYSERNILC
jgi:hypothetical protein